MRIKTVAIATVLSAALLTGCETTSSRPYKASTDNILAFQGALKTSGKTVNVASFTAAEGIDTSPSCRAFGALDVAPGKTPIEFIHGALKEELFEAGVYDVSSPNTINGEITALKPTSFGSGKWVIGLKMSSDSLPAGYTVDTEYKFKTSYSAIKACQNVVDAFTPAVQELLSKVVADPKFADLTK